MEFSRRLFLSSVGSTAIAGFGPVSASAGTGSATTRAGSWLVGDQLSLAALLYAQSPQQELVDRTLGKAEPIAKDLGVAPLPPFPKKSAKQSTTYADIIHYLIKGDGAQVGVKLGQLYDNDHAILFELAAKSNLLILLYQPKDDSNIGGIVQDRANALKLPTELWMPLTSAIKSNKPQGDIKDLVFKMHKDVLNYLISKIAK